MHLRNILLKKHKGLTMKIVAVTACPTGIAHTYMVAELLQKTAEKHGHKIKVETQGAIGAENKITDAEAKEADYVIIASDIKIDNRDRFEGKAILEISLDKVIKDCDAIIKSIEK